MTISSREFTFPSARRGASVRGQNNLTYSPDRQSPSSVPIPKSWHERDVRNAVDGFTAETRRYFDVGGTDFEMGNKIPDFLGQMDPQRAFTIIHMWSQPTTPQRNLLSDI